MSKKNFTAREQYFHPDDPAGWLKPGEPFVVDGLDWRWAFVIYKEIPGFPGYCAGTNGTIWTRWTRIYTDKGCGTRAVIGIRWIQRKPSFDLEGRHQITLNKDGKKYTRKIHRIVLETHIGPCPSGFEGCHWDDDRSNNRIEKLRWDTKIANAEDAIRNGRTPRGEDNVFAKLTEARVRSIRDEYAAGGITMTAIAIKQNVDLMTVSRIVRHKTWVHIL
jgi:hypothetical protein